MEHLKSWNNHVASFREKHPELSFREALQQAKKTYRNETDAPASKPAAKTKPKRKGGTVDTVDIPAPAHPVDFYIKGGKVFPAKKKRTTTKVALAKPNVVKSKPASKRKITGNLSQLVKDELDYQEGINMIQDILSDNKGPTRKRILDRYAKDTSFNHLVRRTGKEDKDKLKVLLNNELYDEQNRVITQLAGDSKEIRGLLEKVDKEIATITAGKKKKDLTDEEKEDLASAQDVRAKLEKARKALDLTVADYASENKRIRAEYDLAEHSNSRDPESVLSELEENITSAKEQNAKERAVAKKKAADAAEAAARAEAERKRLEKEAAEAKARAEEEENRRKKAAAEAEARAAKEAAKAAREREDALKKAAAEAKAAAAQAAKKKLVETFEDAKQRAEKAYAQYNAVIEKQRMTKNVTELAALQKALLSDGNLYVAYRDEALAAINAAKAIQSTYKMRPAYTDPRLFEVAQKIQERGSSNKEKNRLGAASKSIRNAIANKKIVSLPEFKEVLRRFGEVQGVIAAAQGELNTLAPPKAPKAPKVVKTPKVEETPTAAPVHAAVEPEESPGDATLGFEVEDSSAAAMASPLATHESSSLTPFDSSLSPVKPFRADDVSSDAEASDVVAEGIKLRGAGSLKQLIKLASKYLKKSKSKK